MLYYAQAKRKVEAINKTIINLIKRHVGRQPHNWLNKLGQVLWAYRNSPKDSIRNMSYKLGYGHGVVLLVEVNLQSIRLLKQDELLIDDYWNSMFDKLNELESERLNALENIV